MQLRFEPLTQRHVDGLVELVADPDVQRFTRVPSPPPADFARTWAQRYEEGRADGTREGFAILDAESGAFLGIAIALIESPAETKTAELGYIVSPSARGRGIATEALRMLTAWAFNKLGAKRLELRISVGNEGSKRVAERCGYVLEGVLRSVYMKDGVREDTELWSRLRSDPEPSEAPTR